MSSKPKIVRALSKAASIASVRSTKKAKGIANPDHARASPAPGESPIVLLRVQVVGCSDVLAKDRNGKSDPFVVVSLGSQRYQTPVVKRSLSPVYNPKDATFDFPLYQSIIGSLGALEFVAWDKDTFGKDYLGEIALPLDRWFRHHEPSPAFSFDDPRNLVFSETLMSSRDPTELCGTIELKLGFASPDASALDFGAIYADLVRLTTAAAQGVHSAPPNQGVGTVGNLSELDDDGLSSSDERELTGDESDIDLDPQVSHIPTMNQQKTTQPPSQQLKPSTGSGFLPKVFSPMPRRSSLTPKRSYDSAAAAAGAEDSSSQPPSRPSSAVGNKTSRAKKGKRHNEQYNLSVGNDILGIVMLEVNSAEDLPKLKNMTRTGWDMDPFAVISFGKKVFRTRVVRHSLDPVWNEKLLFHVRSYESGFHINFAVLDWDKLSSNDTVGASKIQLSELLENVPKPDPTTGIYPDEVTKGEHDMQEFRLPIVTPKDKGWEANHSPYLRFRARFQPYEALRQRFWRQYLKQYDTDNSSFISHLEMTSMLDSLGSTLSPSTIDEFFTKFNKRPHQDDLSFDEAVQCLEEMVSRPRSERKRVNPDDLVPSTNSANTPLTKTPEEYPGPQLGTLDFSGPSARPVNDESIAAEVEASKPDPKNQMERTQLSLSKTTTSISEESEPLTPRAPAPRSTDVAIVVSDDASSQGPKITTPPTQSAGSSDEVDDSAGSEDIVERVINIGTCPLCHRPRMSSKAEMDIITHLAVCASGDWARVDRLVVGNYVTASQAQRKWYTKVISKFSSGAYYIGANSANIIVQNRMTGQLEEEKMQGYVRLGIRLLYKGAQSQMEGSRARRLLKSLSVKQGIKYDAPESAREIPPFIAFHNLNLEEVLDPLESFKTFNEFFYRKLKMEYRPVAEPDNPARLVSAADCRMMAFETISEATKLWIKGKGFTVGKLLGDQYKNGLDKYDGGALVIFRLAPQDYHRFHVPVDGRIGPMTTIPGEYYTVNPQAIRTTLDVYGENVRIIVPIDSPTFGRVMCVCVGAMMVGSIVTTVNEGDEVKRGDEYGYFAFGGSTIVILFEKGVVEWDEDILINGKASLETLVQVGMGIGRAVAVPPSFKA